VISTLKQVTGTQLKSQNAGKRGYTTSEVGDLVLDALA
jgi:3-isopropylmalate dehydrogenase